MRVVFFGGGAFGVPALRMLAQAHEVRMVLCPPPRPAGRKLRPASAPAAAAARALSLPLCESESAEKTARECRPDVVVACDYGKILSPEVLRLAPRGAINIHPSLLPRWRGAAPIQRTLMAGDKTSGVSIMQMDSGLDTGAILLQETLPVADGINCGELSGVLAEAGASLLLRALRENPPPRPQEKTGACYAAKIRPAECALNFADSAESLERKVRALSPTPGARAFWDGGKMLKVYAARAVNASGAPGEVLSADADGVVVACGTGALSLLRLQQAGRRILDAADFARGFRGATPPAFQPPPFAA